MLADKRNIDYGKELPPPWTGQRQGDVTIPIPGVDMPGAATRDFVFRSSSMRSIYSIATQVAGSDASILIYGESGTGKELFARLIHTLSDRNSRPFVPVNCGVLQGELFADKFFGHEAGAFTGANKRYRGAFETAENGTLFLDEVGEIPQNNQVDFLRVLEERSFRRMGGEKDMAFQARIVAATNRPLMNMVKDGAFRADLFYRLNVVPVSLPPLRSRKEDIALLTDHLFSFFRHRYHRHDLRLHDSMYGAFAEYPWPGNVRELRNLMERLVLLAKGTVIFPESLPPEMRAPFGTPDPPGREEKNRPPDDAAEFSLSAAVLEAEFTAIARALKHTGGRKKKAADLLGISERSLRYKIAEHGL